MLKVGLILIIPLLVAIYTISFGVYNWRNGNRVGAVGVCLIACCSVVVPLLVMLIIQ